MSAFHMCVKILGMLSPSATLLPLSTFTEEKHYDVVTPFIVNISKLASDRWIFFLLGTPVMFTYFF